MVPLLEIIFALSVFAILYTYLIYPALLVVLSAFFGRPVRASPAHLPTVAVIIPAYNEERILKAKIENVLALDYPAERLSVWVGSDCSTDRTDDIVRSFDDPRVRLWIAPSRGGKTQVLNNLIPRADAEIVLLTDANTMHRRTSLRTLVRNFNDMSVGAVAGHVEHMRLDAGRGSEEILYRSFETWQKRMESALHSTISAFGGFYAIRKELYRPLPLNAYSNDDVLIPMNVIREGFRVVFDAEAVSEEDVSGDVRLEFGRRVRIGAGNFQAFFWLLDFLNPFKGWPAFCYLSHKVLRWFSPLCIIAAYASAGVLSIITPLVVYKITFGFGVIACAAALVYAAVRVSILRPAAYFFMMNAALVLGLFRYCAGIKSATWARTDRK